ncbi:MAG: recombinase family protein [Rickettsiales bacterium]|jgi:DNA invertase Pin-like site-specific DNA recombinase|nr:recombinase family protein [Rickettsiales bacterium]
MPKIKCAIYVRKSTEHGLEQEFNSLHNQEDACKAYIASQAFNEWEFCKTYVDGGISGGTMERPALKQMLDDMSRGLIQTVVVYKVDRLSRSIMDFHNMMGIFDKYNCSFVSITQSFDTSTSMGKLTLNMLLSFAQFEREVSSERVRDKIRASRAKGLWTGGIPWLGYDVVNKKLVVNPTEATQVRQMFEMYLQIGSIVELGKWLRDNGIFNKKWTTANGSTRGGNEISVMTVHRLLREKIYVGFIEHKRLKTSVRGEHEAIISHELFDAVQARLTENTNGKTGRSNASPNLLAGKLYNGKGTLFTNQRATKGNRHYYSSRGFYLPAPDIDRLATDTVREFLDSDMTALSDNTAHILKQIDYENLPYFHKRQLIKTLIDKAIYTTDKITFFINTAPDNLQQFISPNFINQNNNPMKFMVNGDAVTIEKYIVINKGFSSNKYKISSGGIMSKTDNNHLIVRAFATAWKYKEMYERLGNVDVIAAQEKASPMTIYRYLNLAYICPTKVNEILSGKITCTVDELFKIANNA